VAVHWAVSRTNAAEKLMIYRKNEHQNEKLIYYVPLPALGDLK
jgi:hypothetical protein